MLGALMEKSVTTPDLYPLTLNSLTLACNQRSSRDPVTAYEEEAVLATVDGLRDLGLVFRVDVAGSRVAKFRAAVREKWALDDGEYAILTLLLLRGPQTPGQLRSRAERLYDFKDLAKVLELLESMQARADAPESLVCALPRQRGSKEVRYGHTLGGAENLDGWNDSPYPETGENSAREVSERSESLPRRRIDAEEFDSLQAEVKRLNTDLAELKAAFEAFRAQF